MIHTLKCYCGGIMKRSVQGFCIILGSIIATVGVLAVALAWGPHHCEPAFPTVIGCAIGSYESLAAGMIAAGAALFAGWLAWSGVQTQIAAEEMRATADRVEVEQVLQEDLDTFAEALGAIWKILECLDREADRAAGPQEGEVDPQEGEAEAQAKRTKWLGGVIYGIEKITGDAWLSSSRKMATALGWRRRRDYEQLFRGLERLGEFRDIDNFDAYEALAAVRSVSIHFELLREDTARYSRDASGARGRLTHSAMLLSVRQASIDRAQKRRAHNLGSTFLRRGVGALGSPTVQFLAAPALTPRRERLPR
jgi:hypothetical protein